MTNRTRNKKINFWVTEEEKEQIDDHIQTLGFENRSAFLRRIIFETNIIQTDLEPLKNLASEINAIGNNVNQVARKANQERIVHENQIKEILDYQKKLEEFILNTIDTVIKKGG